MRRPGLEAAVGLALFAYASLASTPSAELTLRRPVRPAAVVRLRGWRRRWSQVRDNQATEKTFAESATGIVPPYCLGLNLEPDAGAPGPNGVLIEVSEREVERLAAREVRYDPADLTAAIEPQARAPFERVLGFVAKPANFAPTAPPGAVILAPYVRAVEAAFGAIGANDLDLFRESTEPQPVDVIEAVLVRDEIPAGNPREW